MIEKYLREKIPNAENVELLPIEASTRSFFRIHKEGGSSIAMVFPEESENSIKRIEELTAVYRDHDLKIPEIEQIIDNRIIVQQDLGNQMLDDFYIKCSNNQQKYLLREVGDILLKLSSIPLKNTASELGKERMRWEMDFFIKNFASNFLFTKDEEDLKSKLYKIVESLELPSVFAHRDLHSRNMLFKDNRIWLVDFQDSLAAPKYYDLVSSAYDSYLDIGKLRVYLFGRLAMEDYLIDFDQLNLTALQRNIKALGTFGYQISVRKNLKYRDYIKRTLEYILNNKRFQDFFEKEDFKMVNPL